MAGLDAGLPPKAISYRGVYAMHKYWSKKPPNVVSHFIDKFSKSGDLVLDSFCGSGVAISEAVRSGRKAIGIDLNPIAIEIARSTINPVDIDLLKSEFHKIEVDLSPLIKELYSTSCEVCKSDSALTTHVISNEGVEYELWYSCNVCNQRKNTKSPSKRDVKKCNSPDATRLYFPDVELYENKRINAYAGMRTTDLFSPRAQVMISHLWDRINTVKDYSIRESLVTCFTAAIPQASKMVFVINQRKGKAPRKEVGSWVIGYWTPKEHFEVNAWNCFSNRFKRVLNGKKEIAKLEMGATEKDSVSELISSDGAGYHACIASATNLPIDDEIVDYIFTDPPHGNRQPYLELSLIWNSWLDRDVEWDEEIVESEAKSRSKDAEDYNKGLRKFYSEARRVLRNHGKMTVCFNSLDDDAWKSLMFGCLENGFRLVEVSPLSYSATSVVQDNRKNALKTDFALTFEKTGGSHTLEQRSVDSELEEHIQHSLEKGESQFYQALNHVFTMTLPNGIYYPISAIMWCYNSSMAASYES